MVVSMDSDGDGYENKIRNHRNRAGDIDDRNDRDHDRVSRRDDESIDDSGSEVGWNSEDELTFYSSKVKGRKAVPQENSSEDEDDDDMGGDGILLSDLLSNNMQKSSIASVGKKSESKRGSKEDRSRRDQPDEEYDEEVDDDDGEEDDDDDEDDDGEEEDDEGDDYDEDDEDEDDYDEVHNRLLDAIDKFAHPTSSGQGVVTSKSARSISSNQSAAESEFSSVLNTGDVSMTALLGALDGAKGVGVLKKHLADLELNLAAPMHIEKVVSDRLERGQVYDQTRTDMHKWQNLVVANRHVKTLNLTQDRRQVRSFKSMVNRFVPTTPMELDIQMVLLKNGTTDQDIEEKEMDMLQGKNLSLAEIREKQAELAKVKALMFYEQMKRHRLNKIKSKAYRKIHNRKKKGKNSRSSSSGATISEEEEEDGGEAAEKKAYDRVKERMDLRHKNTSKWAKMALQYGHTDKSLRSAYHESVQLGHELSEKINESVQQKDDEEYGDDDDEMLDHRAEGKSRAAVSTEASKAIAQLLSESAGPSKEEEAVLSGGRYRKLFEMDFMRKAADQQRSRAREDAQSILREIQQMENECEQSDDDVDASKVDPKRIVEPSAEELFSARKEVSSLFVSSSGMAMSSKLKLRNKSITTLHENRLVGDDAPSSSSSIDMTDFPDASSFGPLSHDDEASTTGPLGDDNPWLQSMSLSAGAASARKRKGAERGAKQLQVDEREQVYVHSSMMAVGTEAASVGIESDKQSQSIARKVSKQREKQAKRNERRSKPGLENSHSHDRKDDQQGVPPPAGTSTDQLAERASTKIPLSGTRSQADLVQQAFAGPDLEAEFRAYKKHEVDGEYGLDEKRMKVVSEGESRLLTHRCMHHTT